MTVKRILSIILSICIMLTIMSFPTIAGVPEGYTDPPIVNSAYVKERLEKLRTILEGEFFTVDGTSCGSVGTRCELNHTKGYVGDIIAGDWFKSKFPELINLNENQLTAQYTSATSKQWTGYHCFGFACFASWYVNSVNTTDYMMNSKLLYSGAYSGNVIKNTCDVGDIIRCGGHSAVIYSIGEDFYQVIDCNYTSGATHAPSKVRIRTLNYSGDPCFTDGSAVYITRAANYDPDAVCAHYYSNICDDTCNVCGATRTTTHEYNNACDTVCNICGATRTFYGHKYDNDCDTDCNICGKTRTTTHTYTNACDTTCNVCGATRTTTHVYDNSSDATCNVCGATRNIAVTSVSLDKTTATLNMGETLTLTATITPTTATNKTVSWSSSNTNVATVSNGTVTAKAAGTATITAKTADGNKTATCTITVKNPVLASGTCGDNVTWLLSDKGKLTLSGSGATYDYDSTLDVPWYSHRASVKTIEFTGSITRIGNTLFGGLINATSITIPSSVTSIGSYGISNCDSITSLTIPDSVTSIGSSALYGCDALTQITLPANITKISSYMFNECTALESIEIPNTVTSIESYAFYGCSSLKYVSIPSRIVKIKEETFRECTSLEEIVIPDNVIEIETGAFNGCTSLTEITIPQNVTTIGSYAFQKCPSLTDVYYKGTKTDKNEISIGNINNGALTNATWHYVLCEQNGHTYDNTCDASCNVCEETRTTTHTYSNDCDASCNVCGATRTVAGHVYDNDYDSTCNECGDVREVADPNAPAVVVSNVTAKAGDTFTVDVSIKNNSGIIGLRAHLEYDADVLELVSIVAGEKFADTSFGPLTQNPMSILWDGSLDSNCTTNGVVATLTFKVKEDAEPGETALTVTYDPDDIYDSNWDNVEFAVENGTVTIIEYISGDVNGDGKVNNKDFGILRQFLNNWDVEIDELAADVNRDGKVNNKDMGILRQYLNNWGVELK